MSSNKLDELHEAGRANEGTTTPDEDSKEYQGFDRLRLAPKPFSDPYFSLTSPVFNLFSVGSDVSVDLSIFADSAYDPRLVLHSPGSSPTFQPLTFRTLFTLSTFLYSIDRSPHRVCRTDLNGYIASHKTLQIAHILRV